MTKPNNNSNEARVAVDLANITASKAVELANLASTTATALASKTAETTAIISNDIIWMKKSLSGIESKLNEIDKDFVTAAQHGEVVKNLEGHENRLNSLETEKTRITVLLTIGGAILTLLVSLLTYHLFRA